jgi:hypothetical protein
MPRLAARAAAAALLSLLVVIQPAAARVPQDPSPGAGGPTESETSTSGTTTVPEATTTPPSADDAKQEVARTAAELAAWVDAAGDADPAARLAELDAELADLAARRDAAATADARAALDVEIASVQQQRFEVASYEAGRRELVAAHERALAALDALVAAAATDVPPPSATAPPSGNAARPVAPSRDEPQAWPRQAIAATCLGLAILLVAVAIGRRRAFRHDGAAPRRSGASRTQIQLAEAPGREHVPPRPATSDPPRPSTRPDRTSRKGMP